jgi:hypothetical protein
MRPFPRTVYLAIISSETGKAGVPRQEVFIADDLRAVPAPCICDEGLGTGAENDSVLLLSLALLDGQISPEGAAEAAPLDDKTSRMSLKS